MFYLGPDVYESRFTIYKGNVIYCKYFSSYEMNIKLQNLASDFTARFVMDSSGKLRVLDMGCERYEFALDNCRAW